MNVQSLGRARQQWQFAADSMSQFICLLDPNGRVIRANRTLERRNSGIKVEDAGALCLHDLLHRDCHNSFCYLRRFGERATVALARYRRADWVGWDPILKRRFLICARRPFLVQQRKISPGKVFAVVTVDDVTKCNEIENEPERPTWALDQRVEHGQGKHARAKPVHSRIVEALDNTFSVFAMADAGGALLHLNPAGRGLLGLDSDEEVFGTSLLECHAPGVREHLMRTAMPSAARNGSWSGESLLLTRDGREIRTTLVVIAHHDDGGRLIGYSVQEQDVTERVKKEEALRASKNQLRRLEAQLATIQETEQRRIAAELNDGLGHSLNLLKLRIRKVLRQMGAAGAPSNAVESVQQLIPKVEGALNELHRVATDSRPPILDDLGILPTLSWFVREFERANLKTRIEKHINVTEKNVPEPLKITIFRILQEAVNNAVKHSDAGCIRVSLHKGDGVLAFTIEDDGKGFDPDALMSRANTRRGLGMQSMRERAELSGGIYGVTSAVGRGTKVCVWWPVSKATDSDREQSGRASCGLQSGMTVNGVDVRACHCLNASEGVTGAQRAN